MRKLILSILILSAFVAGQQKRYGWVPGSAENYQLDPGGWQAVTTYSAVPVHLRLTVDAKDPVSVGLVKADDWSFGMQHPEALAHMPALCFAQRLQHNTFVCDLDNQPDTLLLVVHDERSAGDAVGALVRVGIKDAAKDMVTPNQVTFTAMRWGCVEYCTLPQYQWFSVYKEKFKLTPVVKTYGPLTPERDGEQIHVKIKSPIPMIVAVLPVEVADRLRADPADADALLDGVACKQRGIQNANFNCSFKLSDGTQEFVLMPEPGVGVPNKKAQVQVDATRCVENCGKQAK